MAQIFGGGGAATGEIRDFAGAEANIPSGWQICDGSAISRTVLGAALFALIGTTYGVGDGSTTFNVPDLRGRVAVGKDNMGGSSANRMITQVAGGTLGSVGGFESHTLALGEIPSHQHTTVGLFVTVNGSGQSQGVNNAGGATTPTGFSGGGGAHNNTPPSIIVNKIIKL